MIAATKTTLSPAQLDQLAINTIRFLSVDAVQKADSGHPGLLWAPRLWPMYCGRGFCAIIR